MTVLPTMEALLFILYTQNTSTPKTKKERLAEVEDYPQCTIIQDGRHTQDHYKFVIIVYPPAWPK